MKEYPLGQAVELVAVFANAAGVATNPSTVVFSTGLVLVNPPPDPTGVAAQFGIDVNVTNPSTGRFVYTLLPTVSGNYIARVVATGTVQAAQTARFRVLPNPLA
jgi:hypothetical protein